jgi:RimJ/RimL family protein N-acetyltransferase
MDAEPQTVILHALSVDEAQGILRGQRAPGMEWAPGFPSFEHVDFLKAFIADSNARREPGPFGLYLVVLEHENLVIGGAGFVGPPDADGAVEIVVELEPVVRKHGYGGEAIAALVGIARANGARRVTTGTPVANVPGQRAIERGGLAETSRDEWIVNYAVDFAGENAPES